MTASARDRYLDEFVRISARLPGAGIPWLSTLRSSALERFAQTGFPTLRDEEWKYTNLAAFERHTFTALPESGAADTVIAAQIAELTLAPEPQHVGHLLVFHNGQYSAALSTHSALPTGVTLQSLATTLADTPEMLELYLCDTHHQTPFGALNTALMSDGAYLRLARNAVVEAPIHLLFLTTQANAAVYPRNVIVAEPGAQATVIEHYVGIDGSSNFTNAITQIFAADGAFIEHYKLQQEAPQSFHVAMPQVAKLISMGCI